MMKRLVLTIAGVALATSVSLTACGKKEQQSAVIVPSPEATASKETEKPEPIPEPSSDRELYQQQVTSELQTLNSQIERLQIQVRQSDRLAREKLSKRIDALTKKMQLRSQLNAELENDMSELLQQLKQQSEPDVQLNDLLQKQALVQHKIKALLIADEQTWEETKFEVDETLATLKQSYEKFQPKPIATESIEPTPTNSNSTETESIEPTPTDSSSTEAESIEPTPTDSSSTELESVTPVPTDSSSTEAESIEPTPTDSSSTEPEVDNSAEQN